MRPRAKKRIIRDPSIVRENCSQTISIGLNDVQPKPLGAMGRGIDLADQEQSLEVSLREAGIQKKDIRKRGNPFDQAQILVSKGSSSRALENQGLILHSGLRKKINQKGWILAFDTAPKIKNAEG